MAANKYANKKQHFVPACYLKAWLDPEAPIGPTATPYLWLFDIDGSNARKKSPEKTFTETDMYTVRLPDGSRDLTLEHGLSELEGHFTRVRTTLLDQKQQSLDEADWQWICMFVAAAQARTVAMRDHHLDQMQQVRRIVEDLTLQIEEDHALGRKRRFPPSLGGSEGVSVTTESLLESEAKVVPMVLSAALQTVYPILSKMSRVILCTDDPVGFITSDHPCTWYDPTAHTRPPMYRAPGIAMRNIEVTFPLSPQQCLLFTHTNQPPGYYECGDGLLDVLNHRHRMHADTTLVACRDELRSKWFEEVPLPADAWENTHGKYNPDHFERG